MIKKAFKTKLGAGVLQRIKKLSRRRGVAGVFFGLASQRGVWGNKLCIVVHVERKVHASHLSRAQRFPPKIGRYSVDVIEVGSICTHALDVSDEVATPYGGMRTGAFTALKVIRDGVLGLVSGHVVLPYVNGQIVSYYKHVNGAPQLQVNATDAAMFNRLYRGRLIQGVLSKNSDWSAVIFPPISNSEIDTVHPIAKCKPPIPIRDNRTLRLDEVLLQYSRHNGGKKRIGKLKHVCVGDILVTLPDRSERRYEGTLAVTCDDKQPFSYGGDSGSLVCDSNNLAVGVVLGGSRYSSFSYVLPVQALEPYLKENFYLFFRK